ncbi:ATP-binding cassette domain-containing protein [Alteromonas lipolytica]|uniref:ABC transporter ATP-binding protein n=1 Tax=Alteromonas lipolytica TaxID=1856405 RepID=A0A1E8FC08_9ALTE|nr:ATP-binding cassette domain-containing protein [Alteromonas lipolytica]OFI33138.1 hypothetical protein BFC17_02440 [Alteromonas lipolytica]GGF62145.1 thiol reductant ABC exporter subunit CydD [Alteromonas lipolytica]
MNTSQSLPRWFNATVITQGVASRSTLFVLVALKTARLLFLIAGYWLFAAMMHDWVVLSQQPEMSDWFGLSAALALAWVLQGEANRRTLQAKSELLAGLELRYAERLIAEQTALVNTHSNYFWQAVWTRHIPALTHWRYDYQVQQYVAVLVPFFALLFILVVNPVVGGSLLLTLPIIPLFMIIVGKGAAALQRKHFVALTRLGSLFVDRLSALPLLASFRTHKIEQDILKSASDDLNERTMKVVGVAFLSNTVLDFFSTVAVALIAVFIGFSLLGEFDIGPQLTLHSGLWLLLTAPLLFSELKALGQYYHQKAEAEAARDATGQWLEAVDPEQLAEPSNEFTEAQTFTVNLAEGLLTTQTLTLCPGDWVAVTGPSGSGKTLFLEALAGHRLAEYRLPCRVAMLTQHPVLLPATIRENLNYQQSYTTAQLEKSLKAVALYDWVSALPAGLDTPLAEVPAISGGQAQRLALARLLLSDAPVWLLDEPTAHLPEEQHHSISALIHELAGERTVLWVSHKPLPESWFNRQWQVINREVTESLGANAP